MNHSSLVFYDTSRVYYSSYYLNGFETLKSSRKLKVGISNTLPKRLKSAIQNSEWQHLLFAMVLFKFQQDDKELYFCIDTHDANSVNVANKTGGYHLPLLQCVDIYFKVNYNPDRIENTPELKIFREKILSISQFFPLHPLSHLSLRRRLVFPPTLSGFRPGLGYSEPYDGFLKDAKYRLRDLNNFQTLEKIVAHRKMHKDIDIFFMTSFRHSSRHESTMARRYQVMKKLSCIPGLNTVIGFSNHKDLPHKYAQKKHRRLSQSEYLETLARSKIAIYTQGIEGCISSKFGLAMALGIAMVGEPLVNNPELLTTHQHLKEQFSFTDPDEIVAHAIDLLAYPEKVRELGNLNATMFDSQLAPHTTAEYVLNTLSRWLNLKSSVE